MKVLPLESLPALNALLNAVCTALLISGYAFIRRRNILAHRISMVSAFICSAAFLVFYVYFHTHAGLVRFGGQGWIRPAYFVLLTSHTILAVVTLPLVLTTLFLAMAGRFSKHRRMARWTLPIWLYVSVTGVVIYWLLFIAHSPISGRALSRHS
jgi:putative membrane protein